MPEIYDQNRTYVGKTENGIIYDRYVNSLEQGRYQNGTIYSFSGEAVAYYDDTSLEVYQSGKRYEINKEKGTIEEFGIVNVTVGYFLDGIGGGEMAALLVPGLMEQPKPMSPRRETGSVVGAIGGGSSDLGSTIVFALIALVVIYAAVKIAVTFVWPSLFESTLQKSNAGTYEYAMFAYVCFSTFLGFFISYKQKYEVPILGLYVIASLITGSLVGIWGCIEGFMTKAGAFQSILMLPLGALVGFLIDFLPGIVLVPLIYFLRRRHK